MNSEKRLQYNNFDFLRFLFALLVVISHSYELSGGNEIEFWSSQIVYRQINCSSIGLNGFFVISGYFIFQSLQRSNSVKTYFLKRILRLYPGLIGVLLITILLIPFLHVNKSNVFQQLDYYTYLPYNLSLFCFQAVVKGVFDKNLYHSINGSLWTIRYEFVMYIGVALLFFIKEKIIFLQRLLLIVFILMYLLFLFIFFFKTFGEVNFINLKAQFFFNLGTFFAMGSLLASINFQKYVSKKKLFLIILLFLMSLYFEVFTVLKHIIFSLLILIIGYIKVPYISTFGKYGDASYGIYIYSFPIQQSLMYYFQLKTCPLMLISCLLSIIFGYLSWHLIEKRALRFKHQNSLSSFKLIKRSFLKTS